MSKHPKTSWTLKRMWVNQPSSSQPDHNLNQTNVLACHHCKHGDCTERIVRIYFISGPVESMMIERLSLSTGWINKQDQ